MYTELDPVDGARNVFDKTRKRTNFVWNALFGALTLGGYGEEISDLYTELNLIGNGIESDRSTYTYALKACVAPNCSVSLLKQGKEIRASILRNGYDGQVHIMTTLIDMYARFGIVRYANFVFNSMDVKNVVSWSAMIACYARNAMPFEALEFFQQMIIDTHNSYANSVKMFSVLQPCAALSALERGRLIHGFVLRRGLDSIMPISSALVIMYARCGKLKLGQRVFDQIDKRDVVSWNSLISSYGVHGFGKKAIQIFGDMVSNRVSPSPITFASVLWACCHEGLVDEGKILLSRCLKSTR